MKGKMLLAGLLCSLSARADDLARQIESFIKSRYDTSQVQVNVLVRTPPAKWPQCEHPLLSLASNARLWSNISVSVRCGQQRRFIQTEVQAIGYYLVSARNISAGHHLTAADLKLKSGRLDVLTPLTLTEMSKALGAVTLRNIIPGQPLTSLMLRRAWVIKAGQPVLVFAQGHGFTISGSGKAMNNAAAEDSVRVRMASGQIVSGISGDDGVMRIAL